jgi:membrane protein YqaA with SNARE-associated domain
MKSMYYWLGKHVHAPYGTWIFALLVFIEGFFIVPVSTLLTFYCLENRSRAFMYAALATATSILAATTGYALGSLIWHTVGQTFIYYIISPETFHTLVEKYTLYQAATVLMVSATPIPFKALTLTAGFCKLPLLPFLTYAIIGRGIKFFAIATGIHLWGHHIQNLIDKYFYVFLTLFIASFVLMWWFLH